MNRRDMQESRAYDSSFNKLYADFSAVIYGIACRVAKDSALAQIILGEVLACMYQQEQCGKSMARGHEIFPIIFDCIVNALAKQLPPAEIQLRINAERTRLMSRSRAHA